MEEIIKKLDSLEAKFDAKFEKIERFIFFAFFASLRLNSGPA